MEEIVDIKDIDSEKVIKDILKGKIFVYPTDTIYGLGCDATNVKAVGKIKEIKKRDKDKPLSVIAPSVSWIRENCIVPEGLVIGKYFPGSYTLILKKKDFKFLKEVAGGDSIGVRIPRGDFTKIIGKSGRPFITTSVNLAGEKFVVRVSEIFSWMKGKVDFVIDGGLLNGRPSTLVIGGKEIRR